MSVYPIHQFTQSDRKDRLHAVDTQIETIFRDHAETRHIPGMAYGVILDGELIFDHGFGMSNIASEEDVNTETVFRIASMTKSFAALAIMQLRDGGRLRLDEPAATYVPELAALAYPTADSTPITVRQLLCMNAGWPQDDPWADRQLYQTDAALSEFYKAGVTWSNPPGVTFEYSNYGYMVLGRIITNVAQMPAIDYINQHILTPLGMTSTVWNASDVPPERLALGYRWEDDQWKPEELLPTGGDVAAFAGLFTTVRDLTRWVGLFQSAWVPQDGHNEHHGRAASVLSPSSLREMQRIWSAQSPSVWQSALSAAPDWSSHGYGFGLAVRQNPCWTSVGHGGGLPGFGSYMCWLPEYGLGIVAFSNVTYGGVFAAVESAVERLLSETGLEPRVLPIAPHLAEAQAQLIELIGTWDDDVAADLFADNFLLDKDKAHRLEALAELHEKHGAFSLDKSYSDGEPITPENWLRGEWRMTGERGWCDFFISLAPTVPPRIQTLKFDSTLPPSPDLQTAMERLAALIAQPTKREFRRLCASSLIKDDALADEVWDQVRLAHVLCGGCEVGEITGGDGATWAGVVIKGEKRAVHARITIGNRGKATMVTLRPCE